jgi:putative oxidoreductase
MVSPLASDRGWGRERLEDAGKLVLRITVGVLMLFHGVDKVLHGIGGVRADLEAQGLPGVMAYGVYVGEVVAPLFILAGLWTRPWAVLYAGTILVATAVVHATAFVRLAPTGGWAAELYVFYILASAAVALLGAGRYAVRGGRGWLD